MSILIPQLLQNRNICFCYIRCKITDIKEYIDKFFINEAFNSVHQVLRSINRETNKIVVVGMIQQNQYCF